MPEQSVSSPPLTLPLNGGRASLVDENVQVKADAAQTQSAAKAAPTNDETDPKPTLRAESALFPAESFLNMKVCRRSKETGGHTNVFTTLPQTVFETIAAFCNIDDLISFAHSSKPCHGIVSGLHWKCTECRNRMFQGKGRPLQCNECEMTMCPDCTGLCFECLENKCPECELNYCERCDEVFCFDCKFFVLCEGCGENSCQDCDAGGCCEDCGDGLCFRCGLQEFCFDCGRVACADCNRDSDNTILDCTRGACEHSYCTDCMEFVHCLSPLCDGILCSNCNDGSGLPFGRFCSERCEEFVMTMVREAMFRIALGGTFGDDDNSQSSAE